MKIPLLKKGYEHFEPTPVVQLALLKRFCKLNRLDIKDEKLMKLLSGYGSLTHKEPDLIWEPKE